MSLLSKILIKWAVIFVAWTAVAFFFTSQALIQDPQLMSARAWRRVAVWELFFSSLWFALTPAVLWLARQLPLARRQVATNLVIYVIASIAFSLFQLVFFTLGVLVLPTYPGGLRASEFDFFTAYATFIAAYLHFSLLCFWGLLLANYVVRYYNAYQERALRASQLEATLTESKLQILKSQLQPHFLFNTLNTISELVHENQEIADKMISRLSSLLRMSLESEKAQEVPLRKELDFLEKYLDIEKARFEERLSVIFDIAPETLDAKVPSMILQPLVENAVRHSIAPRAKGGTIKIVSGRDDLKLRISIEDDGDNYVPSETPNSNKGIGLSNTRERLKALYGTEHRFELRKGATDGLIVSLEIPFQTCGNNTDDEN